MAITLPTLISTPWRGAAGPNAGLLNTISPASSSPNASWADGFCLANMTPISAGGVPPFGGDMNAILNIITTQLQYINAGGQFPFNAAFAAAIGGYQPGMVVQLTGGLLSVVCTVVNNTNNPNVNMTGWAPEGAYAPNKQLLFGNTTGTGYTSNSGLLFDPVQNGLFSILTSANSVVFGANGTVNVTATNLAAAVGVSGSVQVNSAAAGSGIAGMQASAQVNSSGAVLSVSGIIANVGLSGSGTVTTAYGVNVTISKSSGTVVTSYGIYVAGVSGATNNFAIQTNAGIVSLGDTTASTGAGTGALQVAGGAYVAGQITTGVAATASSTNTVTNKVKFIANGVTLYLLASTSAT